MKFCHLVRFTRSRYFKVVLEARVTLLESADIKAASSLSQNKFVCKLSVQGHLYLAR